MLMDDEYLIQKEIEGVPVYYWDQEDVEEKLYEGDEVALTIKTITKEYHTFLGDAQQEVSGKIPIFSGPPANVKTNIVQTTGESVPIVGFFAAYSADTKSVKAKQDYAR